MSLYAGDAPSPELVRVRQCNVCVAMHCEQWTQQSLANKMTADWAFRPCRNRQRQPPCSKTIAAMQSEPCDEEMTQLALTAPNKSLLRASTSNCCSHQAGWPPVRHAACERPSTPFPEVVFGALHNVPQSNAPFFEAKVVGQPI